MTGESAGARMASAASYRSNKRGKGEGAAEARMASAALRPDSGQARSQRRPGLPKQQEIIHVCTPRAFRHNPARMGRSPPTTPGRRRTRSQPRTHGRKQRARGRPYTRVVTTPHAWEECPHRRQSTLAQGQNPARTGRRLATSRFIADLLSHNPARMGRRRPRRIC